MAPDANAGDRKRASARLEPFQVRPKTIRNMILGFLVSGSFVAAGAWLTWYNPIVGIVAGLPCVLFFGYILLFAIPRLARRRVTMTLTPEGIVQHDPAGNSLISWDDVEEIGVAIVSSTRFASTKLAGVRLRSYERYLNSMPPELVRQFQHPMKFLRVFTRLTIVRFARPIGRYRDVQSLADALAFNRRLCGYDVAFGWVERDRSAKKFVALLEQYRAATMAKQKPS